MQQPPDQPAKPKPIAIPEMTVAEVECMQQTVQKLMRDAAHHIEYHNDPEVHLQPDHIEEFVKPFVERLTDVLNDPRGQVVLQAQLSALTETSLVRQSIEGLTSLLRHFAEEEEGREKKSKGAKV